MCASVHPPGQLSGQLAFAVAFAASVCGLIALGRLAGWAAGRAGAPVAVCELLAGAVVGPYLAGLVDHELGSLLMAPHAAPLASAVGLALLRAGRGRRRQRH